MASMGHIAGMSAARAERPTDGGLGCALLWPFADTRYVAPFRRMEQA